MASMHFDSLAISYFFLAFVLPLGRPPAVDFLDTSMSSDCDKVSDSLDREDGDDTDGDDTDVVNLISLPTNSLLSSTDALDTLIFRAL